MSLYKVVTKDSTGWKSVLKMLVSLNDEGCFVFKPDGIEIKCMDVSKFAMLDCFWPKEKFEHYECPEERKVGINFNEADRILGRASNTDSVQLIPTESDSIEVLLNNEKKYLLRGLAVDYMNPPTPKFNAEVTFDIEPSELITVLEDCEVVNKDFVTFETEKDTLTVETSGDSGKFITKKTIKTVGAKARSMYSIPYMKNTIKPIQSLIEKVTIDFANNLPMRAKLSIGSIGVINYYLAPKQTD